MSYPRDTPSSFTPRDLTKVTKTSSPGAGWTPRWWRSRRTTTPVVWSGHTMDPVGRAMVSRIGCCLGTRVWTGSTGVWTGLACGVEGGGLGGGGLDTGAGGFSGLTRVEGGGAHSHVTLGSGSTRASVMPCALLALQSPASELHCAASSHHLAAASAHWALSSAHRPTCLPFLVPLASQFSDFVLHFLASFFHRAADLVHLLAVLPNLAPPSTQLDGLARESASSPVDGFSMPLPSSAAFSPRHEQSAATYVALAS
mmetsp:Transcript_2195/g.9303  ORF Transcript_2195/g.9303 Transcript_2195/m.9303 type:complete len:256 (-) Transcript_2195:1990-2757(-)